MAEHKGRQLIRKIIHHNPQACIVVVGCYAQLRAREILQIEGVDLVLSAADKFKVRHYLERYDEPATDDPHSCDIFKLSAFDLAYSFGDRTRSFLKIQDGCDYFVPTVRSRLPGEKAVAQQSRKYYRLPGTSLPKAYVK